MKYYKDTIWNITIKLGCDTIDYQIDSSNLS